MSTTRPTTRCGISLLEVLISMGILSVGLASVLALIPAGKSQARKAAIDDGRGNLGSAALADVINRGLLRTSIWSATGVTLSSGSAIVFDPLFSFVTGTQTTFPTGLTQISLGNITGAAADEVCRAQDDVVYSVPDDEDSPALPMFSSTGKRLTEGRFSWLATLVPAQSGTSPHYHRLSIVEFHNRTFDASSSPSDTARLTFTLTGSSWNYGSATIGIASNTGVAMSKEQFGDFFRTGTVVLVSDTSPNFRWLRVLMAAPTESPDGTTVTEVDLTFDQDVTSQFTPTRIDAYAGAVGVAEQIVRLEGESPWVTP